MLEQTIIEKQINTAFDGRYRFVKPLGEGGMGSVYLIETTDAFKLPRAIKILNRKTYNQNLDIYAEISALKRLNHPGIPKIMEVGSDDENVYVIQEYVQGVSFRQIIENNGAVDEETAVLWMGDVAETLNYLHSQGVIHRDIKPTNIMVTTDGHVKVIDFGLARDMDNIDEVDQRVIGTRNYTAPERYERIPADIRTDIYGFGTTFYYLTTGELPLEMSSDSRRHMRVMHKNLDRITSPGIRDILKKCMELNPNKRYQNFNEIDYYIKRIDVYHQAVLQEKRKKRSLCIAALILFVSGLMLLFFSIWQLAKEHQETYEAMIADGQAAYAAYNLPEAQNIYQQAIDFDKKASVGYQGLYETLTEQENYDSVTEGILNLFDNQPNQQENAELLYLLGNAYYEKGDYTQAEPYLKEAVEKEPSIEKHLVLGLNYCGKQEYDQAEAVIEQLKADSPDADAAQYLSGQIAERQGKEEEAKKAYQQVNQQTDDMDLKKRAILALANLYRNEKNYSAMIPLLEEAIQTVDFNNNVAMNELLGEAYYYQAENGDFSAYTKAANCFQSLIDCGYERAYLYRNLAIINTKTGDYDKALSVLNTMKTIYPDDYTADLQEAWILLEIEGEKSQNQRDYSDFKEAYDNVMRKAKNHQTDAEVQMLKSKYEELIMKGWL